MKKYLKSILLGLIPPNEESEKYFKNLKLVINKVLTPSELELALAGKKHRWKDNQELQADWFKTTAGNLIQFENDYLQIFELPTLDEVIESLKPEFEEPKLPEWKFKKKKWERYKNAVRDFHEDYLGTRKITSKAINLADLPSYQSYMLRSFGIGILHTIKDIISNLPDDITKEEIAAIISTQIMPKLDDAYLQSLIKEGGERISAEFSKTYIKEIRRSLIKMGRERKSPYQIARYLHKQVGVGYGWWWKRITRSENVLAIGGAFDAQVRESECNFEMWSAAANACEICRPLNNAVWRIGEGPHPVSSTHPHCACVRVGLYQADIVQKPWTRNPYETTYEPGEVESLLI